MSQRAQDPTAPDVKASVSSSSSPSPSNATASNTYSATSDRITDEQSPTEAFKDLSTRFAEVGEYISYYLAAKADALKVTVRNIGVMAVLGVLGLLGGGAFVITAVVLLERGIAGALGALFGGRWWLGEIVASILYLALLAGGVWFGMKKLTGTSRERTAKKYEQRRQQQRAKFGTDVEQRAQSPGK